MDDYMGVIDFKPSSDVGVLFLTEADLVGGYSYKDRLLKFAKVFIHKIASLGWRKMSFDPPI